MPSNQRRPFLEGLCHDPPARPTAIHGHGLTDEQAGALRRHDGVVAQRLHPGLLRSLCQAVRRSRATVPPADALTDLTWVNLVE